MGESQNPDLNRLIHCFEKGDRSPEVLEALNQAAFQAFHAPWEKQPQGSPTELARTHQGTLPEDDEEEEGPPEANLPDDESGGESANLDAPLALLGSVLKARGLPSYRANTGLLVVLLPFDPKADAQRMWRVRVRPGTQSLQLISSSDAPLNGYSEVALERLCQAFNEEEGVTTAKVLRKHPGASLRVQVINAIPTRIAQDPLALDLHLSRLLTEDQAFWQLLRRERPF